MVVICTLRPPARVALVGDIAHIKDEKAKAAGESLRESISKEAVTETSYSISQMFSSSVARSGDLNVVLQGIENYCVYKFNPSSCMYIDRTGSIHELQLENFLKAKEDPLSRYSMSVINGINRNETRRRALALFCITFLNLNAKDAFIVSLDRKGFDVLGKVSSDGSGEYQWKELRFTFLEETNDVETFCQKLIEMEDEAVKSLQRCTGVHRASLYIRSLSSDGQLV